MNIEGSTALVTGANRGIGRSLTLALLARGVRRVYATARDEKSFAELKPGDQRIVCLKLDVTKPDEVAAAAKRASDITLLFNNAGVIGSQNLLTSERRSLELDFATNFYGMLDVTRAFLPALEKSERGGIVNLLTLLSYASMPALGGYSAAKAAALSLTQALRAELRKKQLTVFGVFPGAVDTDMIRGFEMPKTSPDAVASAILDGVAKGEEDIYPDPMSRELAAKYRAEPKSLERVFGSM